MGFALGAATLRLNIEDRPSMCTIPTVAAAMARSSLASRKSGLPFDAVLTPAERSTAFFVRFSQPVDSCPDYNGIFGRDEIRIAGQEWITATSAALDASLEWIHVFAPLPDTAALMCPVTPVGPMLRRAAFRIPDAVFASIGERLTIPFRGICSVRIGECGDEEPLTYTALRWGIELQSFGIPLTVGTPTATAMKPFLDAIHQVATELDRQHALFLGASACQINVTVSRPTAHERMAAAAIGQ